MATVVMVLAEVNQDIVTKVSRVYEKEHKADEYIKSLQDAIKAGTRKDILAVWKQTNVRQF